MSLLKGKHKQFAYAYLENREAYHSHKENSAYAVFLVETSLFGAMLTTNAHANFIKNMPNPNIVFLILVFFIWCLLHIFMRWQLRNRRIAALQVKTLLSSLLDDLEKRKPEIENDIEGNKSVTSQWLDYLIPRPSSTIYSDVDLKEYPQWYSERYLESQRRCTGAVFAEVFPTYGSIIILITSLVYVFVNWNC